MDSEDTKLSSFIESSHENRIKVIHEVKESLNEDRNNDTSQEVSQLKEVDYPNFLMYQLMESLSQATLKSPQIVSSTLLASRKWKERLLGIYLSVEFLLPSEEFASSIMKKCVALSSDSNWAVRLAATLFFPIFLQQVLFNKMLLTFRTWRSP